MYIFQETSKQNEGSYDGGKWDNVTGISYFKDNEQYPPLNLANIERFFPPHKQERLKPSLLAISAQGNVRRKKSPDL